MKGTADMRSIISLASSLVFLTSLIPNARCDDSSAQDAKKAIRAVLDDQTAAWNKSDLAGFMAGYWKSPKLTFSSGNARLEGWQATFDRYKQRYQSEGREMGKLSFTELDIELLGPDSAFVRGRFNLKTSKDAPTGL